MKYAKAARTLTRETVLLLCFIAFVVGAIAGVLGTVYKLQHITGGIEGDIARERVSLVTGAEISPQDLGQFSERIKALEERLKANPSDRKAWIELGDLYFDLDRPQESIRAYQKALELNPEDPDVITDMGIMYRRLRKYDLAVEAFKRANRIDPSHQPSLYNLGVVLLHDLNDPKGAAEAWRAYLRIAPTSVVSKRIRAVIEEWERRGVIGKEKGG